MILKLKAGQRQGKGLVMVRIALHLLGYCGYKPENCITNFNFKVNGTHRLDIEHLVGFMQHMIASKMRGMMILVQEADRAFPPRMWHDPRQTRALLGCWQDEKLDNIFIVDCHWGDVDLMLRQACQVEIIPKYKPHLDRVDMGIIDIINHIEDPIYDYFPEISKVFPWYDTLEPIY